jgi:hypothetical protein
MTLGNPGESRAAVDRAMSGMQLSSLARRRGRATIPRETLLIAQTRASRRFRRFRLPVYPSNSV